MTYRGEQYYANRRSCKGKQARHIQLHVIHVHVYDQQLYFLEEKGIFSPVKVRIFVRCFSVAIYNMGYSM